MTVTKENAFSLYNDIDKEKLIQFVADNLNLDYENITSQVLLSDGEYFSFGLKSKDESSPGNCLSTFDKLNCTVKIFTPKYVTSLNLSLPFRKWLATNENLAENSTNDQAITEIIKFYNALREKNRLIGNDEALKKLDEEEIFIFGSTIENLSKMAEPLENDENSDAKNPQNA